MTFVIKIVTTCHDYDPKLKILFSLSKVFICMSCEEDAVEYNVIIKLKREILVDLRKSKEEK